MLEVKTKERGDIAGRCQAGSSRGWALAQQQVLPWMLVSLQPLCPMAGDLPKFLEEETVFYAAFFRSMQRLVYPTSRPALTRA